MVTEHALPHKVAFISETRLKHAHFQYPKTW